MLASEERPTDSGFFSPESVLHLQSKYYITISDIGDLIISCHGLKLNNSKAQEYLINGFLRRTMVFKKCIQNIYRIYPPCRNTSPNQDELDDISINLQAFIFNIFGSIDNLAWVWVKEKEVTQPSTGRPLLKGEVGLLGKDPKGKYKYRYVRQSLPLDVRNFIERYDSWFEYIENFRHALAHRIPPYVPRVLSKKDVGKYNAYDVKMSQALQDRDIEGYGKILEEKENLFKNFAPFITHSYDEGAEKVLFHAQILEDGMTVIEMSRKILAALERT